MNTQCFASPIEGWLAGCTAATATLFLFGLIKQIYHPDGLTAEALVAGVLLAFIHFVFIALISAVPAAITIWIAAKLRVRSVLVFAAPGASIGWLGTAIFFPPFIPSTAILAFVLAGLVAGCAFWVVSVRPTC